MQVHTIMELANRVNIDGKLLHKNICWEEVTNPHIQVTNTFQVFPNSKHLFAQGIESRSQLLGSLLHKLGSSSCLNFGISNLKISTISV